MRELTRAQTVERSVVRKYRRELWNPFVAAVKRYGLIEAGDCIAVCVSGGKDSMLLAKMMQMLHRFSEVPFDVRFLVMDPGYRAETRARIEENAALLELPLTFFETDIFRVAGREEKSPCYLCARMRRGHLYGQARTMGCNKIALGHHRNDVIETTLMGMFYGAQLQGMMPKLRSANFPGMELIRPLYCVREEDILAWARYNGLTFIQCACQVAEKNALSCDGSKRQEVKRLIRRLREDNGDIEKCIFPAFTGFAWIRFLLTRRTV